jgi:DNA/RNA-binding domain of Phe-tRNA-synthetase-like protein
MPYFRYNPDILARYPQVVGGIISGTGVTNGESSAELRERYRAEQAAVIARIGSTPLSELSSLAAWRAAFRGFGVDPTQYRCAAEALLRRLTKQGDIPSINTLVDCGNLVSIRYGLPVAVVDTRTMHGGLNVHFAEGTEPFHDLGSSETGHPDAGEVVFTDEVKAVFARRWCWRQSHDSAARFETTDILVTIEAQHAGGRADVEAALTDMRELLVAYGGGAYQSGIIDATQPQFSS